MLLFHTYRRMKKRSAFILTGVLTVSFLLAGCSRTTGQEGRRGWRYLAAGRAESRGASLYRQTCDG
ncbi:hypothetical protein [Paenibacillus piri]|uniref:hypothetical protein n=1 Tax=Paenibacillus piri TaxID=2547395 RepID=UPI0015F2D95C|nr:hypothetical protein [Paenibacillus piri]